MIKLIFFLRSGQCRGGGYLSSTHEFLQWGIILLCKNTCYALWITLIFDGCHRSRAAAFWQWRKNWENNGTEEIGLVTPLPGLSKQRKMFNLKWSSLIGWNLTQHDLKTYTTNQCFQYRGISIQIGNATISSLYFSHINSMWFVSFVTKQKKIKS